MPINKKEIIQNICFTELVYGRINKKLNITDNSTDIVLRSEDIILIVKYLIELIALYFVISKIVLFEPDPNLSFTTYLLFSTIVLLFIK